MVSLSISHVHITVLVLVHEQTYHADRTRAEEVYRAGGQNGALTLVKQSGLGQTSHGRGTVCQVPLHPLSSSLRFTVFLRTTAGPRAIWARAIWLAGQHVQKRNKSSSGLWGTLECGSGPTSNRWSKDVTGSYSLHVSCCLEQPFLGVVISSSSSCSGSRGSSGGAAGCDGCINNNNSTSSLPFSFVLFLPPEGNKTNLKWLSQEETFHLCSL